MNAILKPNQYVGKDGKIHRKTKWLPDVPEKPVDAVVKIKVYAGSRYMRIIEIRRDRLLYRREERCQKCNGLLAHEPLFARCRFGCGAVYVVVGGYASEQREFERTWVEHPDEFGGGHASRPAR